MFFSKYRRKLDPRRRFGSKAFRNRIKAAATHKRVFYVRPDSFYDRLMYQIGLHSKLLRYTVYFLLLITFYYLVISGQFLITEVEAVNNKQVSTEQIREVISTSGNSRIFLIKKNHYLLMTKGRINKLLTQSLPYIREVTKSKRVGHNKVRLELKEREWGFVLRVGERSFLVDDEGIVIAENPDPKDLPQVLDQVAEGVVVGEVLPNAKMVAFILSMHKNWPNKISSQVSLIKMPGKAANQVQFESAEGWTVFFDINRSVLSQLQNLALLLATQIPVKERSKLAYIDLRLEKWAYYCYRQAPCEAQPIVRDTP